MNLRDKFRIIWENSKKSVLAILLCTALASLFSLYAVEYVGLIAWILTYLSIIFEVVVLGLVLNTFVTDLRAGKNEVEVEQKKLEQEHNRIEKEKKELSESKASLDDLVESIEKIIQASGIEKMAEIIDKSGIKQTADVFETYSSPFKNNPGLNKQIDSIKKASNSINKAFPYLKKDDEKKE